MFVGKRKRQTGGRAPMSREGGRNGAQEYCRVTRERGPAKVLLDSQTRRTNNFLRGTPEIEASDSGGGLTPLLIRPWYP